ncbi:hypothetical protein TrCOL_g601 [Triparma columacea]|uniref:Uncharacterized protein n=1 Tax=Triparma columacea TaxID=722753 RepID=A0A9W7GJ18_9STRA|nr:hypothetical protein TrCOL_g601 [Triparma columacea]
MSNVAHSMYASYNKGGNGTRSGGVRLGNWQEELALEGATGFSRAPNPKQPAYYNNHDRVLAHTDRIEASQFQSTAHAAMSQKKGEKRREVGPRKTLKERRYYEQALREAKTKEIKEQEIKNKVDYTSVNSATYNMADSGVSRLSNPAKSKVLFGGEVTKESLASVDIATLPPGDYSQATAVTYWTQQLTNPTPVTSFPITSSKSGNPFARSSTFTNDIRDSTKSHAEGADMGGTEIEGVGRNRNEIGEDIAKKFHEGSSFPTW